MERNPQVRMPSSRTSSSSLPNFVSAINTNNYGCYFGNWDLTRQKLTDEYKDKDTVQTMQCCLNSSLLLLQTRDSMTNQKYTRYLEAAPKRTDFKKEQKGLQDALHYTVNNIFKQTFKWHLFETCLYVESELFNPNILKTFHVSMRPIDKLLSSPPCT